MTINVMLALINHYCLLLVILVLKLLVHVLKNQKWTKYKLLINHNNPQDLVIDMNAIVADLLNNLLPTKIEHSSNNESNVNKQPQDLVLQIDDDSSGSDVIDEGEDPPTQQNIPR